MTRFFEVAIVSLLVCSWAHAGTIPKSLKLCSKNSRNLGQCIKESVEHLRPFLSSGQLGDGVKIVPIEPFFIDDVVIDRGNDFKLKMANIRVLGAGNFHMDKLKVDLRNMTLDVLCTLPELAYSGVYDVNIKLQPLSLFGNGRFNGTLFNGKARIKMIGSRYPKNGVEFIKIDKCGVKGKFDKVQIYLDNLFNGNKELSEAGNQIVNDNPDIFTDEIIPIVEKSLAKKFRSIANGVFELASFDEFFPE